MDMSSVIGSLLLFAMFGGLAYVWYKAEQTDDEHTLEPAPEPPKAVAEPPKRKRGRKPSKQTTGESA